jgi:hypothetical protein
LTPTPYALYATNAGTAANFGGALAGDVTGTQSATTVGKLQGYTVASTAPTNGQVLQYNGTQWVPSTLAAGAYWNLTSNSGTTYGTNFLGTTDNVSLTLRANNIVGWRLMPSGADTPNVIGGYSGNSVTSGVKGATIGGGGASGRTNRVTDDISTIGGGYNNQAGDNAGTTSDRAYATIGGGENNTASGYAATIGGGDRNTASGYAATIGGGDLNTASSNEATVGGGGQNTASNSYATIGGGASNTASNYYTTVGGGASNTASGNHATVPGGFYAAASHYGEMAYASGRFSNTGDAQTSVYVLRNTTTNTTSTELFLDGSGQRITLANNRTLTFDILIVARRDSSNESAGYMVRGTIKNDGGNTALVGAVVKDVFGENDAAWDVSVTADDTNNALKIQVTGAAGKTIRWVASVRTVEVAW